MNNKDLLKRLELISNQADELKKIVLIQLKLEEVKELQKELEKTSIEEEEEVPQVPQANLLVPQANLLVPQVPVIPTDLIEKFMIIFNKFFIITGDKKDRVKSSEICEILSDFNASTVRDILINHLGLERVKSSINYYKGLKKIEPVISE